MSALQTCSWANWGKHCSLGPSSWQHPSTSSKVAEPKLLFGVILHSNVAVWLRLGLQVQADSRVPGAGPSICAVPQAV